MKFTINSKALAKALTNLQKIAPVNGPIPVLEFILFSASDDALTLTAYDQVTSMTVVLDKETDGMVTVTPGAAVLPGRFLIDLLKETAEDVITIETTGNASAVVTFDTGSATLPRYEAADYPPVPSDDGTVAPVTLPATTLQEAISSVVYAAGDDALRPIMASVLFDIDGQGMHIVTTDTRRLLIRPVPGAVSSDPISFPMDSRAAAIVAKTIEKDTETATIKHVRGTLIISYGKYTVTSRPVSGKYPDWKRVVPTGSTSQMSAIREDLHGAVRRMIACADKAKNYIRIDVKPNLMDATAVLTGGNEAFNTKTTESLPVTYTGEPIGIMFNGSILSEILKNLECMRVTFEFNGPTKAAIVRSDDEEKEDLPTYAVVMPTMIAK